MTFTSFRNGTAASATALLLAAAFTLSGPGSASAQTTSTRDAGTTSGTSGGSLSGSTSGSDSSAGLPNAIALTGVIRDFRERTASGGHADFERQPTRGFGHYVTQVSNNLDVDGKPEFKSTGYKRTKQAKDSSGRNVIGARDYIAARSGDQAGTVEKVEGGSLTTTENFAQWYRDTNGSNLSVPLAITLVRNPGTNMYTFNDRLDPTYSTTGGFFPINGQLMGNSGGTTPTQNFHFTYELDTSFVYKRGTGQVFTFTGDDDVWVFIDGKLVIDIGGVHAAVSQTIDVDRCSWLEDGQRYSLKFFFAERHRTQSNFRIDTSISLENAELPATSGLSD